MKKLIQQLFGIFGIKLVRTGKSRKVLPKPNVDNIEIVIGLHAMANRKINVLQVGACDGETSDSIFSYVKSGRINAFMVEPSKTNFAKLSSFYANTPNAKLINAAVADKDEMREFFSIKDEGRWKDSGWARQLASFYREHLVRHGIKDEEIQSEQVRCLTLQSIIKEQNIQDLDVLVIDTEGYDGEIVKMAMAQNVVPTFLAFENAQLVQHYSQAQLDDLYEGLKQKNYVWTHDRINSLAIQKTFFERAAS